MMDTYHTGKGPMNSGYVSYREETSEFWYAYHTGTRPMNYGYVSYREEANELWIRIIQGKGQ